MTSSLDAILSGAAANATVSEPVTAAPEPQGTSTASAEPSTTPAAPAATAEPKPEGTAPATPEGTEKEPATVPLAALKDERAKVKRYTEQVADFDKKLSDQNAAWERRFEQLLGAVRAPQPQPQQKAPEPQKPDFFADPDAAIEAAIQARLAPVMADQGQIREQLSQQFAVQQHGAETVSAARAEIERRVNENPDAMRGEFQRIMSSGNPWNELVKWHKKESALKEIGDDFAGYEAKVRAKILEEMKGTAPAAAAAPDPALVAPGAAADPAPVLPTNLAQARNAGTRSGPAWNGPAPLQDIFDRAQKKTRAA